MNKDMFIKISNNSNDFLFRDYFVNNKVINLVCIETLVDSGFINNFILKGISDNTSIDSLLVNLPCISFKKINDFDECVNLLFNGYLIILYNDICYCYEVKSKLERSISEARNENYINGSMDAFNEGFNTCVGLIRKRIHSSDLILDSINIGKYSNTKVGIMYIKSIAKDSLVNKVKNKINSINIDSVIDSNLIKKFISSNSLFPTIKSTERPDLACSSLLDGKIIIICDNSPEVLILPTFFIDYFISNDDYYQKGTSLIFIRFIRILAFFISILLPSYYISITTYNLGFIPNKLLINFIKQRLTVPFPSFIECLIMIIVFEVLRECDIRSKNSMGTSISILGSLVLGDAAVSAGIISPIMIIVVSISVISSLVFSSIEVINAIRLTRFISIILASLLGIYGVFLSLIFIIINLCNTNSDNYLYPFNKFSFKKRNGNKLYRNSLLTSNIIRGYYE